MTLTNKAKAVFVPLIPGAVARAAYRAAKSGKERAEMEKEKLSFTEKILYAKPTVLIGSSSLEVVSWILPYDGIRGLVNGDTFNGFFDIAVGLLFLRYFAHNALTTEEKNDRRYIERMSDYFRKEKQEGRKK